MKSSTLALSLALVLASPLAAQKMGGSNHNAPSLTQTFSSANGFDVHIDYTAITWADGHAMKKLMNKESGFRMRAHVNKNASNQPLASLRCKNPVNLGGTNMPAGLYVLYFTISDDLTWKLNAQHEQKDDVKFSWELDLKTTETHRSRLCLSLGATKKADECEMTIAFGKMSTTMSAKQGEKAKKKKPASRPTRK